MDFKQLEVFVALANELHFANTARQHHMTASAVTRLVQRLEEEIGVTLLLRNNRRVELTPAGRAFAEFAMETLEQWYRLQGSLQQTQKALRGQLKIYSSVTASYGILAGLLAEFRQRYAGVEIQLHTGDQALAVERVQAGFEEIGIAALPDNLPATIAFKTLTFSPLRFIMPAAAGVVSERVHQLRQRQSSLLNPAELPLIISEQGLARQRLDEWLQKQPISPNIYAQVSGHEAIVSMVALGFGVGLVPELVIRHSPLQDKIRIIEDAPELQAFQIGLCALKSRLELPAVKAFWDVANPDLF